MKKDNKVFLLHILEAIKKDLPPFKNAVEELLKKLNQ